LVQYNLGKALNRKSSILSASILHVKHWLAAISNTSFVVSITSINKQYVLGYAEAINELFRQRGMPLPYVPEDKDKLLTTVLLL